MAQVQQPQGHRQGQILPTVVSLDEELDEDLENAWDSYTSSAVVKQYAKWTKALRDNAELNDPKKRSAPVKFIYSSFARRCEVLARMRRKYSVRANDFNTTQRMVDIRVTNYTAKHAIEEIEEFCHGGPGFKAAVLDACKELKFNIKRSDIAARMLSSHDLGTQYDESTNKFITMFETKDKDDKKLARSEALEDCEMRALAHSLIATDYTDTSDDPDPYQDHLKYVHGKTLVGGIYWWVILYSLCSGKPAHIVDKEDGTQTGTILSYNINYAEDFLPFVKNVVSHYPSKNEALAAVKRAMQYYSSALTAAQLYSLLGWAPLPRVPRPQTSSDDEDQDEEKTKDDETGGIARIQKIRLSPYKITAASALGAIKGAVTILKSYTKGENKNKGVPSKTVQENENLKREIKDLKREIKDLEVQNDSTGVLELRKQFEDRLILLEKKLKVNVTALKQARRKAGHYDEFSSGIGSKFRTFHGFIGFFGEELHKTNTTKKDKHGKIIYGHTAVVGKANVGSLKLVLWSEAVRANFSNGGKYVYPPNANLPDTKENAHKRGRMLSKNEVYDLANGNRPYHIVKDVHGKPVKRIPWSKDVNIAPLIDPARKTNAKYLASIDAINNGDKSNAKTYQDLGVTRGLAMNKTERVIARQTAFQDDAYKPIRRAYEFDHSAWYHASNRHSKYHTLPDGHDDDGNPIYDEAHAIYATPDAWETQKRRRKTARDERSASRAPGAAFKKVADLMNEGATKDAAIKVYTDIASDQRKTRLEKMKEIRGAANKYFAADDAFTSANLLKATQIYTDSDYKKKRELGAFGYMNTVGVSGEIGSRPPPWTGIVIKKAPSSPKKSPASKKKTKTGGKKTINRTRSTGNLTQLSTEASLYRGSVGAFKKYLSNYTTLENTWNGDDSATMDTYSAFANDNFGNPNNYKSTDMVAKAYKWITGTATNSRLKQYWGTLGKIVNGREKWDEYQPWVNMLGTALGKPKITSVSKPSPAPKRRAAKKAAASASDQNKAFVAFKHYLQTYTTLDDTWGNGTGSELGMGAFALAHFHNLANYKEPKLKTVEDALHYARNLTEEDQREWYKKRLAGDRGWKISNWVGLLKRATAAAKGPTRRNRVPVSQVGRTQIAAVTQFRQQHQHAGGTGGTQVPQKSLHWTQRARAQRQQMEQRQNEQMRQEEQEQRSLIVDDMNYEQEMAHKEVQELLREEARSQQTNPPVQPTVVPQTTPGQRGQRGRKATGDVSPPLPQEPPLDLWEDGVYTVPSPTDDTYGLYEIYLKLTDDAKRIFVKADTRRTKTKRLTQEQGANMANAAFGEVDNYITGKAGAAQALRLYKNYAEQCKPNGTSCSPKLKFFGSTMEGTKGDRKVVDPKWYTKLNAALNPASQQTNPAQ